MREPAPPHAGFDPDMRIDWLTAEDLGGGLPGRLGLTFLPGKQGPSGRYPGHMYRRIAADDLAAMREQGVVLLILLVEDRELERWSDPRLVAIGERVGLAVRRFPIPDGAAAPVELIDRILTEVDDARRSGDVAVACMGGVGRTGMVAACALVRAGLTAEDAIARVRQVRHPTAVETAEQEALVRRYADRRARTAASGDAAGS